ncbi:MAG: lytic transglycosylase domain-containing protein [Candidatus Gastranaerophilaceae bacterium]
MFSEMIQGLLNSSGQAKAMQRYNQMNNYVNSLTGQKALVSKNNQIELPPKNSVQSFDNVLKSTAKSQFGMLIKNKAAEKVNASLYTSAIPAGIQFNKKPSKNEILGIINEVSNKYDVDPKLIEALVKQESGFNPNAKSKAGALGLMQLMPSTAKGLGVTDPMDARQNIEGGVKYVKSMLDRFNGNIILALAAYNAGPNAVKKYDGVPPYKETQNYVRSILANYL